jgi:hypothetical protein
MTDMLCWPRKIPINIIFVGKKRTYINIILNLVISKKMPIILAH